MLRVSIAIAKRETARIFGAAKGRLALGLFWIWALLPGLYRALSQLEMDERQQQAHVMAIIKTYDVEVAKHLLLSPVGLMFAAISVFELAPLVTLVLTFLHADSSGEPRVESEALAIATCRERVVGETLGAWGAFCAVSLAVFLPIGLAEVVADRYPVGMTFKWTFGLYLGGCVAAAAYLALWRFVRSYFQTRRMALLASLGLALVLVIAQPFVRLKAPALAQLFPGALDRLLLSGVPNLVARALLTAAAWFVACLALSSHLLHRKVRKPRAPVATGPTGQVAPRC